MLLVNKFPQLIYSFCKHYDVKVETRAWYSNNDIKQQEEKLRGEPLLELVQYFIEWIKKANIFVYCVCVLLFSIKLNLMPFNVNQVEHEVTVYQTAESVYDVARPCI